MTARGKYKVDQWYDVPINTRNMHQEHPRNKDNDSIMKFFVSNLPPRCSSTDLVNVLKNYGEVHGTYIARKFDKLGKRFGFVSYKKDRNMGDLEDRLKDVWIGTYKLYIVLARFVDGVDLKRKEDKTWKPVTNNGVDEVSMHVEKETEKVDVQPGSSVDAGRTFRDTLLNKDPNVGSIDVIVDDKTVAFEQWFDRGLIGRVNTLHDFTGLKVWLKNVVQLHCIIKCGGGGLPCNDGV
ncbi:putative RNA recognition motif domain, nucleotide-binding alpha-beta plait domain superfamily [Helianthus annuus]|nr:putative RNA recognition motif domain, nucleotide-binding alpha-beta plait domain superfamily [Helianthus annuus]